MNREIKFRAWDIGNERMVDNPYIFELKSAQEVEYIFYEDWRDVEDGISRDCHVMQYTGLKDSKEKDTYEGDIIGRTGFFNKVIVWHKNGFYTYSVNNPERLFPLSLDEYDEVIGNIHQNPELLTTQSLTS